MMMYYIMIYLFCVVLLSFTLGDISIIHFRLHELNHLITVSYFLYQTVSDIDRDESFPVFIRISVFLLEKSCSIPTLVVSGCPKNAQNPNVFLSHLQVHVLHFAL